MNHPPQWSARAAALNVLRRYHTRRGDAAERLHALLGTTDRSGQATGLVYGVIRNTGLLDRLLCVCADIRKTNVKPALWAILRLGVYELVFAPKTAEYAVINEAVSLARTAGSHKSAGFVNAVLRSIQRKIASRSGDPAVALPAHCVPRADGSACIFTDAVLPKPSAGPVEYLHSAWSLPQWLVHQWVTEYGAEQAAAVCRASNRHPSVYAWPDTRRISAAQLAERLAAEGVTCRLWAEQGAVQIRAGGAPGGLDVFKEGLFYIQDPAAAAVAAFLDPKPGWTLIDLCAAPGGKTLALALRMKDKGVLIASDASEARLGRVRENIRRIGLSCVRIVPQMELEACVQSLDRVDAVIVDVPCSNTGVLARRVEARHRLDRPMDKAALELQQTLLKKAFGLLKPGGRLVYSTCSVLQEENERQIQHFLSNCTDTALIEQKKTLPSIGNADLFDQDGGFIAMLKRL